MNIRHLGILLFIAPMYIIMIKNCYANHPLCGAIIDTEMVVDEYMRCDTDFALMVVGPKGKLYAAELECASVTGVGIILEGNRAQLLDGDITGCAVGISIEGNGEHIVNGVLVHGSGSGFLVRSEGNQIFSNDADGNDYGFVIDRNADSNILEGNSADENSTGFVIRASDIWLRGNYSFGNQTGIRLNRNSDSINVVENEIMYNKNGLIAEGINHKIWHNEINNNENGLSLLNHSRSPNNIHVYSNEINDNENEGVYLMGSIGSQITNNEIRRNHVDLSIHPTAESNVIKNNKASGEKSVYKFIKDLCFYNEIDEDWIKEC